MAILGAVGAVLCCGAFAVAAASAAERTLIRSDVPSLQESRVRDVAVRQALSSPLRGALRRTVARGANEASSFSGGGLSVLAGSVQLRSQAQSRKLLRDWSRARPRPRKIAIGDGGLIAPRGKGNLVVLVRAGNSVGLVQLRARRLTAARRELTLALARTLAGRLLSANAATPIDDLLDRVRPDGSVTKATALTAFERLYSDIPGIKAGPPAGDAAIDGNLAIGWVLDHLNELSPAQRRAVEQALGTGFDGARTSAAKPRASANPRFTQNAELLKIAKERAEVYRPLLGQALRLELVVGFVSNFKNTADALPVDAKGHDSDDPTHCRIRYSRAKWMANEPAQNLHAMAHEVFHCYEFQLNPSDWNGTSNVAIEGLAEWAAATTVRPYAEPWRGKRAAQYFPRPEASLVKRPYASVFFWGRIEEYDGRPLWDSMPALMATQGFDDLMLVAGATNDGFSDIWPSSFKLDPSMGPAWTTSHPSPTSQADGPAEPSVVTDKAPVKATRFTNRLYSLAPDDDDKVLARVELKKGRARVGATDDGFRVDRVIGAGETVWLCLDESNSCGVCPSGEATDTAPHTDIGKKPVVAVAGGENGAQGTIEFRDPHEKCEFKPNNDCPGATDERLPNSMAGATRWFNAAIKEDLRIREELLPLKRQTVPLLERISEPDYSEEDAENSRRASNAAWRIAVEAWPGWCRHVDLTLKAGDIVLRLTRKGTRPVKRSVVEVVRRFSKVQTRTYELLSPASWTNENPLTRGLPYPESP